jgi:hypothetical protein
MADHADIDHTGLPGVGGAGSVATDTIWSTAGKVAVATGSHTATEQWPPGHEFDYAQITTGTTVTATTEAGADVSITGNAVAYDGSTVVMIEFFCPYLYISSGVGREIDVYLYDGAGSIGLLTNLVNVAASDLYVSVHPAVRITPSAATHTYSIRAKKTSGGGGSIGAGTGGSGAVMPAFMRITKA